MFYIIITIYWIQQCSSKIIIDILQIAALVMLLITFLIIDEDDIFLTNKNGVMRFFYKYLQESFLGNRYWRSHQSWKTSSKLRISLKYQQLVKTTFCLGTFLYFDNIPWCANRPDNLRKLKIFTRYVLIDPIFYTSLSAPRLYETRLAISGKNKPFFNFSGHFERLECTRIFDF